MTSCKGLKPYQFYSKRYRKALSQYHHHFQYQLQFLIKILCNGKIQFSCLQTEQPSCFTASLEKF